MKLAEIMTTSTPLTNYPEDVVLANQALFQSAPIVKSLPHRLSIRRLEQDGTWLALFKGDDLAGWVKLRPITLFYVSLHILEIIYVLPRFRKTSVSGWFLLHLKELIGTPVILGDEKGAGGLLFAGGKELVDALRDHDDKFKLQLLDLRTGEKQPLGSKIPNDPDLTVMIEGTLPLEHLRESTRPPAGWGSSSFDEWMDWFGDISG